MAGSSITDAQQGRKPLRYLPRSFILLPYGVQGHAGSPLWEGGEGGHYDRPLINPVWMGGGRTGDKDGRETDRHVTTDYLSWYFWGVCYLAAALLHFRVEKTKTQILLFFPLREQTINLRVVSQDCTTAIITLMSMNVPQIPEELHFQARSLEALLAHDNTSCLKNFPFLPQTNENWYVNMACCRKSSRSHSQDSFVFWFVVHVNCFGRSHFPPLVQPRANANHADYTQKPNIMDGL